MKNSYLILSAVFFAMFAGCICAQDTQTTEKKYAYIYNDKKVVLNQSDHLFAVAHKTGDSDRALASVYKKNNIIKDSLSDLPILKEKKISIYHIQKISKTNEKNNALMLRIKKTTLKNNAVYQPVFEQGQAFLIPTQEIIVGFSLTVSPDQAREILAPYMGALGIIDLKKLRKKSYLITIDNPANGRCYDVCQTMSKVENIDFAEPNHMVIMR